MRRVIAVLLLATASGLAVAQTAPAPAPATGAAKPQYGSFGIDLSGRDPAVQPGDDFFDYASGTWYKSAEIPADKAAYGMFNVLDDLSRERTRVILEASAQFKVY